MKTAILALTVLLLAMPAGAQQLFDFNGQTLVPETTGDVLSMYSEVFHSTAFTTPLPLDFDTYQYTIVITGLELMVDATTQEYANGVITMYEDAATVADFTDLTTFTDGEAILIGDITVFNRTMFTPFGGTGSGTVNWVAGTEVDEFSFESRLGWSLVTGINRFSSLLEDGFDEVWDGKVEPFEPVTPTDRGSWSEVKEQF